MLSLNRARHVRWRCHLEFLPAFEQKRGDFYKEMLLASNLAPPEGRMLLSSHGVFFAKIGKHRSKRERSLRHRGRCGRGACRRRKHASHTFSNQQNYSVGTSRGCGSDATSRQSRLDYRKQPAHAGLLALGMSPWISRPSRSAHAHAQLRYSGSPNRACQIMPRRVGKRTRVELTGASPDSPQILAAGPLVNNQTNKQQINKEYPRPRVL